MARLIWWAALLAGASYMLCVFVPMEPHWLTVVWKGAGVGLLALWAAVQMRDRDSALITLVLALGAAGDVLIDAVGLVPGALAFAAGHVVAIILYARHRRPTMSASQRLLGWLIAPAATLIAALLVAGQPGALGVTSYAAIVGSMAAFAWTSRFPRYRVGLGAVFFLISDLLIFARLGPMAESDLPTLLIWPLYFAGQALIAWGAVGALARDFRLHHRM